MTSSRRTGRASGMARSRSRPEPERLGQQLSDVTVTRIDGETNEVASIAVSAYFSARSVTVAGGLVWVSVDDDSAPQ